MDHAVETAAAIVALRNEKGSYNWQAWGQHRRRIVALRNEKGSYNSTVKISTASAIVALRNEKGGYNYIHPIE